MARSKRILKFLRAQDVLTAAEADGARWLNHAGQFARQYDPNLSRELLLAASRLERAVALADAAREGAAWWRP